MYGAKRFYIIKRTNELRSDKDDESAHVEGLVTSEGLFDGTVTLSNGEVFYIEPSSRYFEPRAKREATADDDEVSPGFHSVIYRASDVVMPPSHSPACPSHLLHLKRMEESLEGFEDDEEEGKRRYLPPRSPMSLRMNATQSHASHKASHEGSEKNDMGNRTKGVRKKRWATGGAIDPRKTTCMLYLQADHLFFQKFGSEEACIEVMTRHVQRVNSIYKATDFNQDGKPDDISFMIKRIKVHTTDALNDPSYRFPNNYGVEKFLELFSEEDYDPFCLAYMFTYRDFEMGTLGLAWTGDLKNAGGVCEKNGHYRGSMKSLNTGIVTLLNYGKHVPPAVSHVTLAHEIGHNFGSPHDPELCTPGGEDGNYIMFARATSGDKKNNNKFSPCSLKSIDPVLNAKARNVKGCFTEPQIALCGNGVVEAGEECDCGWEEDCRDTCCFPMRTYPPPDEPPCRLTPRSVCSPSQGPCCTTDCHLRFGDKCRDDNGCRDSSYCNGRGPHCPLSTNKPNKTICNEEFVCFMGECTGSICLAYGLESCQCLPGPKDPPTKACELCCKMPGDDSPCLSSFDWNISPYDIPDMFAKPGTPCNDYNGYCDVFQKCREVDPSGPLATLRKLLLSDESIATFKKWVIDHWYAVLFIFAAIVVLTVALTRLLAKRPETKKFKSVTIIHSSTTETVRLPPGEGGEQGQTTTGGVTVHPAAVRTKLPLKKRVRETGRTQKDPRKTEGSSLLLSRKKSKMPVKGRSRVKKGIAGGGKRDAEGRKAKVGVRKKRKVIDYSNKQVDDEEEEEERAKGKEKEEEGAVKVQKKNVRRRRRRKVIDYSGMQGEDGVNIDKMSGSGSIVARPKDIEDSMGKVQNWLLFASNHFPKSKSTPAGLVTVSEEKAVPKDMVVGMRSAKDQSKARSLGNLRPIRDNCSGDQRVRLQVVYKPPFKFSLRLRRAEKKPQTETVPEVHRQPKPNPKRRSVGGVAEGGRMAIMMKVNANEGVGNEKGDKAVERRNIPEVSKKRRKNTVSGELERRAMMGAKKKASSQAKVSQRPRGVEAMSRREKMEKVRNSLSPDTEVLLSESEFLFAENEVPAKVDT
ncbi:hypothetical protein J437_LFUL015476 [Ladona fulva]|uniref:ADAM10 endopeptidase n=1 Tax=Ladona fulva TaxID=123851 RepID=A0A8K0KK65_LADFU|nr:hypothetical protein J437_LFUL015476 [Ladona fulva]